MLYFCSSDNSKIQAIYSGRFAFISNADSDTINQLINKLQVCSKSNVSFKKSKNKSTSSFIEEYIHSKIFINCYTGLILNGYRWIVRALWMFFRLKEPVRVYYKMRTIFYSVMYPLHESFVNVYLDNNSNRNDEYYKSKRHVYKYLKKIHEADKLIINKYFQHFSMKQLSVLFVLWPVCLLCGWFIGKGYTVISQELNDGKLTENNHPLSGTINKSSKGNHSLTERIFDLIRISTIKPNYFIDDWNWTMLKFQSEYAIWDFAVEYSKTYDNKERFIRDFYQYIAVILGFVSEWICLDDIRPNIILIKKIRRSIEKNIIEEPPTNWDTNPQLVKFINFFHLHGN